MPRRIDTYLKDLLPADKYDFYCVVRDFADAEIAPHVLAWEREGILVPDRAIAKIDVTQRVYASGKLKSFLNPFTPVSPEVDLKAQKLVDQLGAFFVEEVKARRGARLKQGIDVATGAKSVVADKLALPEGLSFTPWGSIVVAEAGARRLTEIDPANGSRRSVADNLPIGLEAGPGLPPPYVVTGVAAHADGTLYFSADRNHAIYKIRPQR